MTEQELTTGASGRVAGQPAPTARAGGVGPDTRLRFGVIGYGYWGPQLTRNLDRLPLARVTHIAELAPDRRQAAAGDYPATRVTESVAEVLESDVDAIAVVTPIRTHFPLARQALEAGKHVFIEKPLADSVAHAQALIDLAEERGRVLMVGHTFLYNPAVTALRQLVRDGALGRAYYADTTRANLGLFQRDINVIWDLAPHDLSILNDLFGGVPRQVSAHASAYVRPGVEDVAHLTLRYPDDVLAFVHVSWLSPSKIRRFTVVGDRQMVVYDDVAATEKIRVFDHGVDAPDHTATYGEFQLSYRYGDIVSPHIDWAEPLAVETRDFAAAIREGRSPRSDGREGLRVVRVLEACDRSLASAGAFVDIGQDEP